MYQLEQHCSHCRNVH